jgi:hypothetical protein
MVADDEIQNTYFSELLKNQQRGDPEYGPIEAIRTAIVTDYYARAYAMQKYAGKDDGYIRGFPESNMDVSYIDPAATLQALERAVGPVESVVSALVSTGQPEFFVNEWLKDNYTNTNYFDWTNGVPSGWDEGQDTIAVPVINPDTGEYYQVDNVVGILAKSSILFGPGDEELDPYYRGDWTATYNGLYQLSWTYTDNNGDEAIYVMPGHVNLGDTLEKTSSWVQVKYIVNGEIQYWSYLVGSGDDPEFEQHIDVQDRKGQFLPVIVLMQDKVWFDGTESDFKGGTTGTPQEETDLFKTTNKICKKLGTSAVEIKEEFLEQEAEDIAEGNSGGNAKKWDFFVHFAVPIRTENQDAREYLYHYFRQLEAWQTATVGDYEAHLAGQRPQPINEIHITEAGEHGYNVKYRWSYVHTKEYEGYYQVEDTNPLSETYGEMRDMRRGECETILVRREGTPDPEYRAELEDIFGESVAVSPNAAPGDEENHDYCVIIRQGRAYGAEAPYYEKVIMMGLGCEYTVNTAVIGIDGAKDYRFRYADAEIWDEDADPETEGQNFRFPMHMQSLLEMGRLRREEAVMAGLSSTVFLVEVQKKKWYQTGFFKWLIIIIAVVIVVLAIINPGFLWAAAKAVAAALGLTATLAVFIIFTILSFAVAQVLALASALIGGTAGQIFAVIAAIAMAYMAYAGAPGGFSWVGNQTTGWAMAAAFVANVNALVFQPAFAIARTLESRKVMEEYEDWTKERRERIQALKDAMDGVGDWPAGVDPWDLVQVYSNPGAAELPDDYLKRTVNPNPGMDAIDTVLNFTELAVHNSKSGENATVNNMFIDLAEQRGAA